jgi:PhnB protein
MAVSPHLMFCGQCEEAFRFYKELLGGQITMLSYGKSPMAEQVPLEWRDKIVHATFTLGDSELAGADVLPEQYERPQGFYVLLGIDGAADAERIFRALAENGVVRMPIQQTFWSVRFGVLIDRFGIPWEVNCRQEAPPGPRKSREFQATAE